MEAERDRLEPGQPERVAVWRRWGPYVAARQWGTVREDYSADGDAWRSFPFDHARSRAYRWGEDGIAGLSDDRQNVALVWSFWNGRDPFLKERLFGLAGHEGNHGEDVKEYFWPLDATPSASWLRFRYHYPRLEFPYQLLRDENARRSHDDPEYELVDTGVFTAGWWAIDIAYGKAAPGDICARATISNQSDERDTLHVLPTLICRNTWAWRDDEEPPRLTAAGDASVRVEHARLPPLWFTAGPGSDGSLPRLLFCDNETNTRALYGAPARSAYPKDGINDRVVYGAATVNPSQVGTKAAAWWTLTLDPGQSIELRARLCEWASAPPDLGDGFAAIMSDREREADAFYRELTPEGAPEGDGDVLRQSMSGLVWSKQFYRYDVGRWLDGDPTMPPPPPERRTGRNRGWRHLDAADILLMPDTWEYPWFAAWDLAFHAVAIAHVDSEFAKEQLLVLCREWYAHPNGQLPAYEWSFDDANPPVHAWAAMRVFEIDGRRDYQFLKRIFHKLLLNFTWWVNRKDAEGNNVFEGGFLGLDNIGPFNRSEHLPIAGILEQSDGTGWMARYCLDLLEMALTLARHDHSYEDLAIKFLEHFAYIAVAMNDLGLWSDEDGFFYDVVRGDDGSTIPVKIRSMVGLVPLLALAAYRTEGLRELPEFARRARWFVEHRPHYQGAIGRVAPAESRPGASSDVLLSVVTPQRLRRVLSVVLDEDEFLSPYGLRSLSRCHRDAPAVITVGGVTTTVDYEPAESRSGLFGGNSNWRGPIWFPLNFLVIEALRRYHTFFGSEFEVECPTGSGRLLDLAGVADELADRLIQVFRRDASGRRPVFGSVELFQRDPRWRDLIPFHEYFHGDTGAGLGASHQTGWTALVADLILARRSSPAISSR